jgi:hypothetical protein
LFGKSSGLIGPNFVSCFLLNVIHLAEDGFLFADDAMFMILILLWFGVGLFGGS